mmetsp:Transcript_5379/g.7574  ORF Transcript_5379/g.7574 Transcript_5379/m.7574 type:complete len:285 (+) Transcript_5379:102-956(+)
MASITTVDASNPQEDEPARRVEVACRDLAVGTNLWPFTWEEIELEPKATKICLSRTFRTMEYEILHTGGFLRLATERGRVYWVSQNASEHRSPDWKLHFSVVLEDIPTAWNILTRLFVEQGCDFGMKAVAQEAWATWPEKQRGRELTVYIFQHSKTDYPNGGPMLEFLPEGSAHNYWLGPEFERDSDYWWGFVRQVESAFKAAHIRTRGCAHGDLWLGLDYSSLRNEAFVLENELFVYPPNKFGWNGARHAWPMKLPAKLRWRAAVSQLLADVKTCERRSSHRD